MTETVTNPAPSQISARRKERFLWAALFVGSLCVYLKTLCPTIFTDDCGEIATAVVTGGVIHPPGYPLYSLLGQAIIHLLNFGEPAWRLGLLSALSASGAVSLTYALARRAGLGTIWSVTAALAFAFTIGLWQQATKVETYALNAFFVALIFNQAAKYDRTGARPDLLLTAFFCGLALTNHMTIVCSLVGVLWLIASGLRRDAKPTLAILQAVCLFVLPLSLYATIWIAAADHPGGQIWGDPSNWQRFYLHVTGARYHGYLMSQTGSGIAVRDLLGLPALLWQNLGWLLIGVVPGIARGLWNPQTRRLHQAMLIAAAAYLLETSAYGILNIFEYYTPLLLLLCIWSACGVEGLAIGLGKRFNAPKRTLRVASIGCCFLVTLTALMTHWASCDRSRATFIRDLALNTLRTMPPNAVLLTTGDNRAFPIWYAQDVLGVRRDVTVLPRTILLGLGTNDGRQEMSWFIQKLGAQHPELVDASAILRQAAADPRYAETEGPLWGIIARALDENRPVFVSGLVLEPSEVRTNAQGGEILTRLRPALALEPAGLSDRLIPLAALPSLTAQAAYCMAAEQNVAIDNAPDALMSEEPDGNITNIYYGWMLCRDGLLLERTGDGQDAVRHLQAATQLNASAENLDALGFVCAAAGDLPSAISAYQQALALDPENSAYQGQLRSAQRLTASAADAEAIHERAIN